MVKGPGGVRQGTAGLPLFSIIGIPDRMGFYSGLRCVDQFPSGFVNTLHSRIGTLLHFKRHQGVFRNLIGVLLS
jgi:hypothetical protein